MSREESGVRQAARAPLPKKLFGYEVIDFIGEGAGSRIYAVSHPKTHQLYALKHVVSATERDQRFVEQLENEYEVARQVKHPAMRGAIDLTFNRTLLRKVTDAGLVLELFDGVPLDRHLPRKLDDVVDVFIQTGKALAALHAQGFVHCDLKPNNILRSAAGEVKVIDLGQACKSGVAKKRIQGTPDYIAPEQVKCEPVTARTDVYNFGATLYWALCGQKLPTLYTLKKGENSFLVDQALPSPRESNERVPETLSNLVMECVRTSPWKRPGDMNDIARRLELVHHVMQRPKRQAVAKLALV